MKALARERPRRRAPHHERPATRGECADGPRPCPYVGCVHHLMLDVMKSGAIKFNFVDLDAMDDTCSLDVAERGALSCEAAGEKINLTRERVRQVEARALEHLREMSPLLSGDEYLDHGAVVGNDGRRRLPIVDSQRARTYEDDLDDDGDVIEDDEDDEDDEFEGEADD